MVTSNQLFYLLVHNWALAMFQALRNFLSALVSVLIYVCLMATFLYSHILVLVLFVTLNLMILIIICF